MKSQLGDVARGEAFLLQGGIARKALPNTAPITFRDFFRVFLQMAVVLTHGAGKPVVKVGRIAGQFAKPRSSDTETKEGETLPSYRGDIINDIAFTEDARRPRSDAAAEWPNRQSAATLNLLRAFASGGFCRPDARARMDHEGS